MPSLYNPQPLTQPQRLLRAVTAVQKLGKVPLVTQVLEVDRDDHTKEIVPNDITGEPGDTLKRYQRDISPLVQVPCEDGSTVFVCPWCQNHQVKGENGSQGYRYEDSGLFWHGTQCYRPNWQYSHAECGQPDYDSGW